MFFLDTQYIFATPSVSNYKSFQKIWRDKLFQNSEGGAPGEDRHRAAGRDGGAQEVGAAAHQERPAPRTVRRRRGGDEDCRVFWQPMVHANAARFVQLVFGANYNVY